MRLPIFSSKAGNRAEGTEYEKATKGEANFTRPGATGLGDQARHAIDRAENHCNHYGHNREQQDNIPSKCAKKASLRREWVRSAATWTRWGGLSHRRMAAMQTGSDGIHVVFILKRGWPISISNWPPKINPSSFFVLLLSRSAPADCARIAPGRLRWGCPTATGHFRCDVG